ncbi:MAG: GHKL domain-containing protein [Bacteroidetes bacterium]|jgi:signal transduction histidine kinase|nr:GHKL domain-containing protein [Bacteroidota bacterium]
MISTVLRNLLSNAIKFTENGEKVSIVSTSDKNELTVTITDSGVGISKDRIDNLFNISEAYSTSGTKKEKGSGLGLKLCKEFIEKHHGKIWVERS